MHPLFSHSFSLEIYIAPLQETITQRGNTGVVQPHREV